MEINPWIPAAVTIILLLMVFLWTSRARRVRDGTPDLETLTFTSPMASKTWAAHIAVQKLDQAVITGTATEIELALSGATTKATDLIDEIHRQREAAKP